MNSNRLDIAKAQRRWVHVGPYYAMFPMAYVEEVIQRYTHPGDAVLDPFAGRFSTTAVASYTGRPACGIEISPLGWLYGRVKLNPGQRQGDILRRVEDMGDAAEHYASDAESMDEFFHLCYCAEVRRFLLACRSLLKWKTSSVDATVMANIMIVLHHGIGRGLSNQMHQAKAMAPRYSIRWWKNQGMETPPKIDPVEFLHGRIRWRYAHGIFQCQEGKALLGDSCNILMSRKVRNWADGYGGIRLLFTSPPYWSLVNYFKDQWLRLWMLGEDATQLERSHPFEKRFAEKSTYCELIKTVFTQCASMMRTDGVVVVRTDERQFTRDTILATLRECFPAYRPIQKEIVTKGKSQTSLFNPVGEQYGERDIVLGRNSH